MKKAIPVFVLLYSLIGAVTLLACSDESCLNSGELIRTKLERARVVFVGKVIGIDRYDNLQDVRFQVSKVYKGEPGDTVTVNSVRAGTTAAVCGTDFREGEEYLVYADGIITEPGESYFMEVCGGAKKLTCADYDLGKLNAMAESGRL